MNDRYLNFEEGIFPSVFFFETVSLWICTVVDVNYFGMDRIRDCSFSTEELVGKASAATLAKNSSTLSVLHLREAVSKEKMFDFLQVFRVISLLSSGYLT